MGTRAKFLMSVGHELAQSGSLLFDEDGQALPEIEKALEPNFSGLALLIIDQVEIEPVFLLNPAMRRVKTAEEVFKV